MAEKRVKLKSSDDEMFEVDEAVAFESQAVKNMIEDTGIDAPIPLPNVSSKILAKVIEYCKYHVENQKTSEDKPATPEDDIKAWDADFVKVDQATLVDLIEAANYLNIKDLRDLTFQAWRDMILVKTPEVSFEVDEWVAFESYGLMNVSQPSRPRPLAASGLVASAFLSFNGGPDAEGVSWRFVKMAEKRVKLKSSDDEMFEVDEAVAFESQVVKNVIEDTGIDAPIPLPNVSSKILAKVIEYCKYHVENQKTSEDKPATPEDDIKAWDADFVKVDQATLFDLIEAADYLNIKDLLDLTCQTAVDTIKGKMGRDIWNWFNIKKELTPVAEETW